MEARFRARMRDVTEILARSTTSGDLDGLAELPALAGALALEAAARGTKAARIGRTGAHEGRIHVVHSFTVIATGPDPDDPSMLDAFHEAGCSDALVSWRDGQFSIHFDREAATFGEAVSSAWLDVLKAGADVRGVAAYPDEPTDEAGGRLLVEVNAAIARWAGGSVDDAAAVGSDRGRGAERGAAVRRAAARGPAFRADVARRAGGLVHPATVAAKLRVSMDEVAAMAARGELLAVDDDGRTMFAAAQFRGGSVAHGLARVLAAFGDMDPWGVLQLMAAPLDGFGDRPASILDMLGHGLDDRALDEIVGLARGWAQ